MKLHFRSLADVGAVLSMCLVLGACGAGGAETASPGGGEPQRGGTLTYLVPSDVASLDPAVLQVSSGAGAAPAAAIFDSLLVINAESGEVEPKIAESMTADKAAKVWTLTLRKGVEFSDGTPYDAGAVKYNWDRIKDPKIASIAASDAAEIASMTVVSPTELRVALAQPDSAFDRTVAQRMFMIGSPTAMKKMGADFGNHPVGAGPFVMEKWVRDSTKTFTRNDNYYDAPRPYLDKVVMQVATDANQASTALKSGQADLGTFWDDRVVDQAEAAGLNTTTIAVWGSTSLTLNMTKAPFDDKRVRLAVSEALDAGQAAEVLGTFRAAEAPFKDDSPYNYGMAWPEPDEEHAQELFDAYVADHGPIEIDLGAFQSTGSAAEGKYIQSVLNQFDNVNVELEVHSAATALSDVFSKNFQAHLFGSPWFTAADLARHLETGAQYNVYGFSDPAVDVAIKTARSTTDKAKQDDAYRTIVAAMIDALPMIQYGARGGNAVYTDAVHDVELFLDGNIYLERVWKS